MYLSIYDQRIPVKKFGFFLNGLFHIKNSVTITQSLELVPDSYKNANFTGLLLFDASGIFYACSVFYFYRPNVQLVFDIHFGLGAVMFVAYCLVVPESPRWLFQRDGPKSKEAINVLNYIAWFNGSSKRIPHDSHFDMIGQVVNESNTLNQTTAGRFHSIVNITMNQSTSMMMMNEVSTASANTKKAKTVGTLMKELYCNKKISPMTWKNKVVTITMGFNYYFVMFNIGSLPGNIFEVGIIFGVSELLGIFFGAKFVKLLPDWTGYKVSMVIAMTCNLIL